MAEAPITGLTREGLQEMMTALIAAAKEPNAIEKAKLEKERAEFLRKEKESLELAKAEMNRRDMRRKNCAHLKRYKGQVYPGWQGQVNSGNNMVVPVCKYCNAEWPPFSANLLPDGGRQGVNFEDWDVCNTELLNDLHKRSFNGSCDRNDCFICHPKEEKVEVKKAR